MATQRPADFPEWDINETDTTQPDSTRRNDGWIVNGGVPEKPPYQFNNYQQNLVYKWVKSFEEDGGTPKFFGIDTGAVNVLVVQLDAIKTLRDGLSFIIETPNANTGAVTLALSGLAVKNVVINNVALTSGQLPANTRVLLFFNTANDNYELKTFGITSVSSGFKNELINGDIRISQRGDFTIASAIVNDIYYLDMWKSVLSVITADKSQKLNQTIATGNKANTLLVTATSTASGHVGKKQIIEEFEALSGKQKTLTSWVKSNSTDARLVFFDGTTFFSSSAHTGGGGWELLTVTFTVNATPTSASYAGVFISSNVVGNVSITSGDFVEFTQIQLENGDKGTNFEQRYKGLELSLAQRYYWEIINQKIFMNPEKDSSSTIRVTSIKTPVNMRVAPTVVYTSAGGTQTAADAHEDYIGIENTGLATTGLTWVLTLTADATL